MIQIAIAEDNPFSLQALMEKLHNFSEGIVQFTATNGKETLLKLEEYPNISLLFMDIEMPEMNGIEATLHIKQKYPHIKIIIITIFDDDDYIFNAIKAGADSYILKESKAEKIIETIRDTLEGGAVMSPSIAIKALNLLKNQPSNLKLDKLQEIVLTKREQEILDYLSQGNTNKTIAGELNISAFTVKRHIENIYQKLQAQNRVELIEKARKNKLI